ADWHEAFYEPERERLSIVPVFVAIVSADATVTLNAEHADYRWLPLLEALETVAFSGQRAMLRHEAAEFVDRQPSALQRKD
ncbi:MAG: NUDIX hydrolase, partial [Pseudomonadota bacterium]